MVLSEATVLPETTLVEALGRLDSAGTRILLVVDESFVLKGVLTDGDIRRCILKTGKLESLVSDAFNRNPTVLTAGSETDALFLMKERKLDAVPIVDENGVVVDCVFRDKICIPDSVGRINLPVVMMAGGLGTRLYPYTKILPKPLVPVNDVPIAERIINSFKTQGCTDFLLIVNHKKEMIKAYFNEVDRDYDVRFVEEREFLGTGGGLSLVKNQVADTFILTNCDILIKTDFSKALDLHRSQGNSVTMIVSLKNYVIPYGTVEIDVGGGVAAMTEKPTIPFFINTGCYIVERSVLDLIQDDETIDFPDVICRCMSNGLRVGVYPVSESSWLDMGQPEELARMSQILED